MSRTDVNRALLSEKFSRTQTDASIGYGADSRALASLVVKYFDEIGVDMRVIATGAGDSDIVGWYPLTSPTNEAESGTWLPGRVVNMALEMTRPKTMLCTAIDWDWTRALEASDFYGTSIYSVNNRRLHVYEKIFKPFRSEYANLKINPVSMFDIVQKRTSGFDAILAWTTDFEYPFVDISSFVEAINPGGFMAIMNSSDATYLYNETTDATPIVDYHEKLKSFSECFIYHVPVHFGVTIVAKRR